MRTKEEETLRKLMAYAMKTPEGREKLKEVIQDCFASEYVQIMIELIDGDLKPDRDVINSRLHDKMLDNYNDGIRSMEDLKILLRGNLSPEETKELMDGEKHEES